jgi:hypothetical protein
MEALKQYIPLQSSKSGIKSYKFCESSSGYLWSFIIYTGRDARFQLTLTSEEKSKTAAVFFCGTTAS